MVLSSWCRQYKWRETKKEGRGKCRHTELCGDFSTSKKKTGSVRLKSAVTQSGYQKNEPRSTEEVWKLSQNLIPKRRHCAPRREKQKSSRLLRKRVISDRSHRQSASQGWTHRNGLLVLDF